MLVARVLLSLACVAGLIWYAGRRLSSSGRVRTAQEHDVRVVGRQSVSRHAGVAVVAVGARRILVGYGDQQVTMLTELGPVVEPAPEPGPAARSTSAAAPRWGTPTRAPRERATGAAAPTGPGSSPVDVVDEPVGRALVPAPRTAPPADALAVARPGRLEGSVLSPATWRATVRALQDRTVRR